MTTQPHIYIGGRRGAGALMPFSLAPGFSPVTGGNTDDETVSTVSVHPFSTPTPRSVVSRRTIHPLPQGEGRGEREAANRFTTNLGQSKRPAPDAASPFHNSSFIIHPSRAFTLIELLVVISIIGLLAGMIIAALGGVTKYKYLSAARSEMSALQNALENYKSDLGFYPPGTNLLAGPLLFELLGVTNTNPNPGTTPTYQTMDGRYTVTGTQLGAYCGIYGVVNCTRGGADAVIPAKSYLTDLHANQVAYTNISGVNLPFLVTAVGGPDQTYNPLGITGANPWRYNSANPTNNPGAYDLYVQLKISGKMYLINNWSKQTPNNSSLP